MQEVVGRTITVSFSQWRNDSKITEQWKSYQWINWETEFGVQEYRQGNGINSSDLSIELDDNWDR